MLKKRDLTRAYIKLATVHRTFETIISKNEELENAYYRKNPNELVRRDKILEDENILLQETLSADEHYILHHIQSSSMKNLIISLFEEMRYYQFSSVSSIPSHVQIKHLTQKYSRYDIFDNVTLYQHTINCAICATDICKTEEVPDKIKENIILLAILHDFGKSPLLIEKLPNSGNYSKTSAVKIIHNIYSALYAEEFLKNYIGDAIQKETYLLIIKTLRDHHNDYAEDSLWLNLLKSSDFLARDKEEKFISSLIGNSASTKEEAV